MTSAIAAPPPPRVRLSLGVTGHRQANAAFAANLAGVERALAEVLDHIAAVVAATPEVLGAGSVAPIRLHSILANGADQIAAEMALVRGWELVSPLPFGRHLYTAINAQPLTRADAEALLSGKTPADAATAERGMAISALADRATVLELADQDARIAALMLARFGPTGTSAAGAQFEAETSVRVAQAATIVIEQSDIIIGIWDAATAASGGGTGHTIAAALALGAPVIWIEPARPENWHILRAPEALASLSTAPPTDDRLADLSAIVAGVLAPDQDGSATNGGGSVGGGSLRGEPWRDRSHWLSHAYRRVEALFGGDARPFRSLAQRYETPAAIGAGSGAGMIAALRRLPGEDPSFAGRIESGILQRFAWADGSSAYLSDSYRGGMTVNFLLSGLAVVIGIAYIPFATSEAKWVFAVAELLLLATILFITGLGNRRRWHGRWFETRRVAEYLRHSPLLLALGVARAPGRWPRGADTTWPEWYARQAMRDIGLPRVVITPAYLRIVLADLIANHVVSQRDYHRAKAARLTRVHHNLDKFSQTMFQLAVVSVTIYLLVKGAVTLGLVDAAVEHSVYKIFTFFGVLLPTFGATVAGLRYFGDFERFADISEITAEKLDAVHGRITLLLQAPDEALTYAMAADLAHAADDIVIAEIENWQAVFGGKHITVPV